MCQMMTHASESSEYGYSQAKWEGDSVTVSDFPDMLRIARGNVTRSDPTSVTVETRQRIHDDGVLSFRIDLDQAFIGVTQLKNNLVNLLTVTGNRKCLELIVDHREPRFARVSVPSLPFNQQFNQGPKHAIVRALQAEDYLLLRGIPGTGKTTAIVQIAKELVNAQKSVLLTAYTHSAVDHVLLKLVEHDIICLRLGDPQKV